MSPRISIIIVNYNSHQVLGPCLDSIYKHVSGVSYEIIVVDNASEAGSVALLQQKYPEVKFILNKENPGFGAANNIGAQEAQGDYLFFLNPDTLLLDNAVFQFFDFLENQKREVVSCGGNLVRSEGVATTAYGNFPSVLQEFGDMGFRRFFPKYYDKYLKIGKKVEEQVEPFRVPYLVGADIFIRKEAFLEAGGFDDVFFLYYEETDLFYRLHQKGYASYILPKVKIVHLEGPSLMRDGRLDMSKWMVWEKSKYHYFRKNKGFLTVLLVKKLQLISLVFHYFFGRTKYPLGKALGITWRA
ncbi:MAG: glycosyltransferase family 2 protein [Bacteroidales bacterium]|nr:glycosyltransferase family 2 protein [Bacteroidales bacterium]